MAVKDWSVSAGSNASVGGVTISEGMARADVNNAMRAIMADVRADWNYRAISPEAYGAAGDGTTNDATALQNAINAAIAGNVALQFQPGKTYITNTQLTVGGSLTIMARGAKIKAANSAVILGAILYATGQTKVFVVGGEWDGNAANNGADYGIWFNGGSSNSVREAYIHDTAQAGIVFQSEDGGDATDNRVISCGRANRVNGTGATDNHGIMVYSNGVTALKNTDVRGNYVYGAYRKGITAYSATPGTVLRATINDNTCEACGVTALSGAGIYISNAASTADQEALVINGNICTANYVNFDINTVKKLSGSGNISQSSTGAHGVILKNVTDGRFGVVDADSATGGIRLDTCLRVSLVAPVVSRPNSIFGGFGAGIEFLNSIDCQAIGANVTDDRTAACTITIASPGVVTSNAHGRIANEGVTFTTTGALPTGLVAGTTYYVVSASITTNTFQVSATPGGAAINTSGSQSGTHTVSVPKMTHGFIEQGTCAGNVAIIAKVANATAANVTTTTGLRSSFYLEGSATYDPPSIATGAIGAETTVTVTGAALGDMVDSVSFSLDTQGIEFLARVQAANTVKVIPRNPTAGTIDLASGTIKVRVAKQ